MRALLTILVLAVSAPVWAADVTHQEAARKFLAAWMNVDRPRLIEAFSRGMGNTTSSDSRAVVLEALESPEFEALYVKHLVRAFSVDELLALNTMAGTPGFRIWNARAPTFSAQLLPELLDLFRNNSAEFAKRAADKQKKPSEN